MDLTRVSLGLVAAICAGCLSFSVASEAPPRVEHTSSVRVQAAQPAPETREVTLEALTSSAQRGALSFTFGGRLASRTARVGDRVQRGQMLATLDARAAEHGRQAAVAQRDQLASERDQLQRDLARYQQLEAGRTVALSELERLEARLKTTEAALIAASAQADEAGRQRGEAQLLAPYDGVITAIYAEPGETVGAGTPIVALSGSGQTEVHAQLPESLWVGLQPDTALSVTLPALNRTVPAHLRDVGGGASPQGLFPVVFTLDEPVAAGLSARVHLAMPLSADALVPVGAVVDPTGQAPAVLRVVDGHAQRVPITVEALLGDQLAVSGALHADDAVIIAGQVRLLDGDAVQVLP